MFDELKSCIDEVNNIAIRGIMQGITGKSAYVLAVKELYNISCSDHSWMESIINEIRCAARKKMITPFNMLNDVHYYLGRISIDSHGESLPDTLEILYKEDNDVDVLWIFGLPFGAVITIEWNVYTSGRRCFDRVLVQFDMDERMSSSMTGFFIGFDIEII